MKPCVLKTDSSQEYFFKEGCYILELSNSPKDEGLSIARARVEQGMSTQLHQLSDTIERYVILEGEGEVTLGTLPPQAVAKHDVIIIPADCPQSIVNAGQDDLIFLVICSPRFFPKNYQEVKRDTE